MYYSMGTIGAVYVRSTHEDGRAGAAERAADEGARGQLHVAVVERPAEGHEEQEARDGDEACEATRGQTKQRSRRAGRSREL